MQRLREFFQQVSVVRILLIGLLGMLLITTTACNRGDLRGARPYNPPVQAGGQNNPYKQGGDGYTRYNMTEDPAANDLSTQPEAS